MSEKAHGIDPARLNPGETVLREIASDKRLYWRDHAVMALASTLIIGLVLWVMDNEYAAIGAMGAILAIGVRGLYLASEQLSARWWLTSQRLLLPGNRAVTLLEIETARRLIGDVQIITRAGDKHLLKHIANADALVEAIASARDKRRKAVK